jgi:hypothetical protein
MTQVRPAKSAFMAKSAVIEPRSSRSFSLSLWRGVGLSVVKRYTLPLTPPKGRGGNHERFRPIWLDLSSFCRGCVFDCAVSCFNLLWLVSGE